MSVLKCNDYAKFLGVPIDKSLTWGPNIDHAALKINALVKDTQTTKIIYFLDDVGSMKINGLTITWNIVSCIFINRLPRCLFLTQKMLKRSFSPFPSSGVVNSFT